MPDNLVSIMMPAYNAEKFIRPAIESILTQTYTNWELIIVNDGSTDQTREIVAQFHDPRIRLIDQQNSGEAVARNAALKDMRGNYVAFLDADDIFLANHLELTTGALGSQPEWDGVYTDGVHIDTLGNVLPALSSRRRGPFQGEIFEQLVRASDVFGPPICVVLRREKVTALDLWFDTRIVIGPDWDFFTRFSEYSKFGYIDHATCKYRIHKTNISVQANRQIRLDSLVLCREKAILTESFPKCSTETRVYVFYDLLVNLLNGNPRKQDDIISWIQFRQLPDSQKARILRLAARNLIASEAELEYAKKWLKMSRRLRPLDLRRMLFELSLNFSPSLLARILQIRYGETDERSIFTPFSDLDDYLV